MKKYYSNTYDSIYNAMTDCELHQSWNVIDFYPKGIDQVTVVYYVNV